MKKIDYTDFLKLFKNFFSVVIKSPIFILIPLSFAYLLVLQVLLFVKNVIGYLYNYFFDEKDDAVGVRIAKIIAFAPAHLSKGFAYGGIDVCIFVFGFFYDLTNKIMTLGKSETYFVEL